MADPPKVEPQCQIDAVTATQGLRTVEVAFESLRTDEVGPSPATASSSTAVNSTQGRPHQESQAQGFRPSELQSKERQPSPKREPPRSSYVSQGLEVEHPARSEPSSQLKQQSHTTPHKSSQPHSPSPSTPGPCEPTLPTKAKEQNQCVICYEPFSSRSILMPCSHEVDFNCVLTWLKECYNRRNNLNDVHCPLCRGEVKSIQHDHKPDGTFSTYDVPSGLCVHGLEAPLQGSQPIFHLGDPRARLYSDPVGLSPWTGHNNLPPPEILLNLNAIGMHINEYEAIQRHRNNLRLQRAVQEGYRQQELLELASSITTRFTIDLRHLRPSPTVSSSEVQRAIPEMILHRPNDESDRPGPSAGWQAQVRGEQRVPLRREFQDLDSIANSIANARAFLQTLQDRGYEIPAGWRRSDFEGVTGAFGANRDSQRVMRSSGVEPSASRVHSMRSRHSWWRNSGLGALYRAVRGWRGSRHEPGEGNPNRSQEGPERHNRSDSRDLATARPYDPCLNAPD